MKPLKTVPATAASPGDCTKPAEFDRMNGDLNALTGNQLVKLRNELEMALTRAHDAKNFDAYARLLARREEVQELILGEQLEW